MYVKYLDAVCEILQQMKETQGEPIRKAAVLVGDTIINGGLVYTFGSGHSQLLSQEVHSRAGGLYPVMQIADPLWGRAERLEGFAEILLKGLPLKAGEPVFVISNSGRNPEPIEVAMQVREMGLRVIAVTAMAHSKSVASRHSSGKKLYELADVVLDTGAPPGDACLALEGLPAKTGAVSTVLGAAIMNAVMAEAAQYMLDKGHEPPVLMSANLDGSDEFNARVMARYERHPISMFGIHAS
ncbi:MAG TPA: SIS domain-containing protein [Anaerolineae bacterium]|nr:SIS domain-containing protein [Anaerolineae bacterium]